MRGARDAGRKRQRQLLQRELRQRHLPHAHGRHAGRHRRCERRRRPPFPGCRRCRRVARTARHGGPRRLRVPEAPLRARRGTRPRRRPHPREGAATSRAAGHRHGRREVGARLRRGRPRRRPGRVLSRFGPDRRRPDGGPAAGQGRRDRPRDGAGGPGAARRDDARRHRPLRRGPVAHRRQLRPRAARRAARPGGRRRRGPRAARRARQRRGGGRLRITSGGEELVDLPVDELLAAYESLPARLG